MMRRTCVSQYGQRLVESGFGMADVISDALRIGMDASVPA